jgi:hypothetical protein
VQTRDSASTDGQLSFTAKMTPQTVTLKPPQLTGVEMLLLAASFLEAEDYSVNGHGGSNQCA